MASGQPYDELGRILAEGGDIALGILLSHGADPSRIAILVRRRMADASPETIAEVEKLARESIAAAEKLSTLGRDDELKPSMFPMNPDLFGQKPEGRRALVSIDFQIPGMDKWYRLDVGLADLGKFGELQDEAMKEAMKRIGTSPGAFGVPNADDIGELNIRYNYAQRRY